MKETGRVSFLVLKLISAFRGFEMGLQTRWLCGTRWRRRRHHAVRCCVVHHRHTFSYARSSHITIHTHTPSLSIYHYARVSLSIKPSTMASLVFFHCRSKGRDKNNNNKRRRGKKKEGLRLFDYIRWHGIGVIKFQLRNRVFLICCSENGTSVNGMDGHDCSFVNQLLLLLLLLFFSSYLISSLSSVFNFFIFSNSN